MSGRMPIMRRHRGCGSFQYLLGVFFVVCGLLFVSYTFFSNNKVPGLKSGGRYTAQFRKDIVDDSGRVLGSTLFNASHELSIRYDPKTINLVRDLGTNTTFKIHLDLPMNYRCHGVGQKEDSCSQCLNMEQFAWYLNALQNEVKFADLYIVPLDHLARLPHQSAPSVEHILSAVDALSRRPEYQHFGGSNHIFLCLTKGCKWIMQHIIDRHPLGKDTRAMWVGDPSYLAGISDQWPCPNRVLSAPESLLQLSKLPSSQGMCKSPRAADLAGAAASLLRWGATMIDGGNRWLCSRKAWATNLEKFRASSWQGCIPVERHNLCFASVPKCASSSMNVLLRRMNGIEDWSHPPSLFVPVNGLHFLEDERGDNNFEAYNKVYTDTSTVKVAFLRHPEDRFYSAYLHKMHRERLFWIVEHKGSEPPSLDFVVSYFYEKHLKRKMHTVDVHFRPMVMFSGLDDIRYDFVGYIDSLGDDVETLLKSLGLWEKYGASGFGANADLSFKQYKGMNLGSGKPAGLNFSPESLKKIHEIYAADFARFGFRMSEPNEKKSTN